MNASRLLFFITVGLILALSAGAQANGWHANRIIEIGIESEWHHLGDGIGFSSFVVPDAEGIYWEKEFKLSSWQIRRSKTAHLSFYLLDTGTQYDSVEINGFAIALPSTKDLDKVHVGLVSKTLISIPIGLLRKGPNSIRFEATPLHNPEPGNTHDDFEFADVVLVLSR